MSNELRQGDPLFHLLFNLTGEVLSKMLLKAHDLGMSKAIDLRNGSQRLTHLHSSMQMILLFLFIMTLIQ